MERGSYGLSPLGGEVICVTWIRNNGTNILFWALEVNTGVCWRLVLWAQMGRRCPGRVVDTRLAGGGLDAQGLPRGKQAMVSDLSSYQSHLLGLWEQDCWAPCPVSASVVPAGLREKDYHVFLLLLTSGSRSVGISPHPAHQPILNWMS